MNFGEIKSFLQQVVKEWGEDKASRLAAAMAYYTVFSIPPLLVFVLAIAGRVFEKADERIQEQLGGLLGPQAADAVGQIIENANRPGSSENTIALIVGIVTLLFGASNAFAQLQDALNTIWDVAPDPDRGILGTIKDRLFSFTVVLGVAFFLLVSLVISAGLSQLTDVLSGSGESNAILGQILSFVISFVVITVLFALMFKLIPDVIIKWHDVWVGAAVTSLLFSVGKFAIGLYLGQSSVADSYGAAGALIILLLWVNYSAQILFFGAEFTQVYANRYGSRVVPDDGAVPLDAATRAEQGMPTDEQVEANQRGASPVPAASAAIPATTAQALTPIATPPPHTIPLANREEKPSTVKRALMALVPIFTFLLLRRDGSDA